MTEWISVDLVYGQVPDFRAPKKRSVGIQKSLKQLSDFFVKYYCTEYTTVGLIGTNRNESESGIGGYEVSMNSAAVA